MKRLMTTTAVAMLLGTSAMAGGHMASFNETTFDSEINLYASDLLGARVYATENEVDVSQSMNAEATAEWDDIGEINEILLDRDGQVQAVIVGVGGFLGIGEKDVAVNMENIQFVKDGEDPDDYFLVINSNASGLEEAPAYERTAMEAETEVEQEADQMAAQTEQAAEEVEQGADQMAAQTEEAAEEVEEGAEDLAANTEEAAEEVEEGAEEMAAQTEEAAENVEEGAEQAVAETEQAVEETAEATERAAADATEPRPGALTAPTIERDGFRTAALDDLNTEDLTGARVYGVNDEDVGEISELLLTDDGQIDRAVVDVGGFLGLGEHSVAVGMNELTIIRSDDTGDFRVYIDSSKEALEAQPEYEG